MMLRKPIILLALSAIACSESSTRGPDGFTRTDSAGVEIVDNSIAGVQVRVIDSMPLATLGVTDRGRIAVQPVGAVLLPNGGVLIAEGRDGRVHLFDSTGLYLRAVVAKGAATPETAVESVTGIFASGTDSVYVVDATARTVVVLDANANVVRRLTDIDFRPDSMRQLSQFPTVVAAMDDGSLVTRETRTGMQGNGPVATRSPSGRLRMQWIQADRHYRRGREGEGQLTDYGVLPTPVPFRDDGRPVMEMTEVVTSLGDDLFHSTGDTLSFNVYAPTGQLRRIVRVDRGRVEAPRPDAAEGSGARQGGAPVDMPPFFPDVIQLDSDGTGRIWATSVEPSGKNAVNAVWYVFNGDGSLAEKVVAERSVRMIAVRGEKVLASYNDAGGQLRLVLLRLR